MVRKILEEKIVSIPEVKDILENLVAKIGEENFDSFQDSTLKYAQTFSKIDPKKVDKIKKMLMTDYALDENIAIMVINIMPTHIEELKVIFEKDLKAQKLKTNELNAMLNKIHDLAK